MFFTFISEVESRNFPINPKTDAVIDCKSIHVEAKSSHERDIYF